MITAGTYLTKRRRAAGFSLREISLLCAIPMKDVGLAEQLLGNAEADKAVLDEPMLSWLGTYLRFDSEIYGNLVAGLPVPPICSGCGCSWHDPCRDAAGPCAWADAAATICTRCAHAGAA